MSRPLTVVQMLPALHSGGVERGTLEIARALVAAGHRSIVISHGGRLVDQLLREGSQHILMPVHRKSLWSLLQVRPLRRLLASLDVDVVHARSRVPAWLAWLALRKLPSGQRPHFVTTVHGLNSVSPYSEIMTAGDVVIAVSETVRQHVLAHYPRCDPRRIRVILRGVDPREFPFGFRPDEAWLAQWRTDYPQLDGQQVVCLPGRITRLKGHEALITLIGTLRAKGRPVHGLVVGGAEPGKMAYLDSLKAAIKAAGLQDHITFTGLRSDIRDVLSQCDVALSLSTKPETFGRTTLEALSLGTPVVGWDQGGVGEILRACHPEGLVVAGDLPGLAAAVCHALDQGRRTTAVQGFRLETMCAETLATYAELCAPPPRASLNPS